jgi:hypothetical protein
LKEQHSSEQRDSTQQLFELEGLKNQLLERVRTLEMKVASV